RPAHRLGELGQHRGGVGRADGAGATHPQGADPRGQQRGVLRRQTKGSGTDKTDSFRFLTPLCARALAPMPANARTVVRKVAAMDIQSLPRYCGLPDSPKGWGEPDGHGKKPSLRLRDYVVLSLLIMICFPINLCVTVHLWVCHRKVEILNSIREKQMGYEIRRSIF